MSQVVPSRPSEAEYAAFFGGYVRSVPEGDVIHTMCAQLADIEGLLGHLPDDRARSRYAPDKWSVKEVVGHLSDVERVMAYRMLRIARADATPLPGFEQDDYVRAADFDARGMGDLLSGFRAVRASTLSLVRELDAAAWIRTGVVNDNVISARALAYIIAGHTAHHLRVLRERYDIVGAGAPAPLPPV